MAETLERTYTVPLRQGYINTPRFQRTKRASSVLRQFICKHMKAPADKVRIGQHLNLLLWERGMKNPPARVKVVATKDADGLVKVELAGKSYADVVRPKERQEEPQTLKEKLKAAVGGTEAKDETPAAEPEQKETPKQKKAVKKAA